MAPVPYRRARGATECPGPCRAVPAVPGDREGLERGGRVRGLLSRRGGGVSARSFLLRVSGAGSGAGGQEGPAAQGAVLTKPSSHRRGGFSTCKGNKVISQSY